MLMTWNDQSFSFGAILTSDEMTEMQGNFEAMANGESGAPRLDIKAFDRDIQYQKIETTIPPGEAYYFDKGFYAYRTKGSGIDYVKAEYLGVSGYFNMSVSISAIGSTSLWVVNNKQVRIVNSPSSTGDVELVVLKFL
jgi:hypothetical protein